MKKCKSFNIVHTFEDIFSIHEYKLLRVLCIEQHTLVFAIAQRKRVDVVFLCFWMVCGLFLVVFYKVGGAVYYKHRE